LFDDDDDGLQEGTVTNEILTSAEGEAASLMLIGFTEAQLTALGNNDLSFRNHVAWVALEFASERRTEFTAADGKGRFWAQYERAMKFFTETSKSKRKLKGQTQAGANAQEGGSRNPVVDTSQSPKFVFAPDKDNPTGTGGF
jgi:hypothetical protein